MESNTGNGRIYYFELLRAVSCIAVIVLHASAEYCTQNFGSSGFWLGNVLDSAVRFCVPVFVMISGALMLDENYICTKEKIKKHVLKIVLFFVFWSAVSALFHEVVFPAAEHRAIGISRIAGAFITGGPHLWFCYMIAGLYLITPLLRLWVKPENKRMVEYFLILAVLFTFLIPQCITVGEYYSAYFKKFRTASYHLGMQYVGGFTVYYVLGWYLNHFAIHKKKTVYALGIAGVICTALGTYALSVSQGKAVQLMDNMYINVLLPSIAVFLFVKNAAGKGTSKMAKAAGCVAKYSAGIYGSHGVVLYPVASGLKNAGLSAAVVIPVSVAVVFLSSLLISRGMSKVPFFKKLV